MMDLVFRQQILRILEKRRLKYEERSKGFKKDSSVKKQFDCLVEELLELEKLFREGREYDKS